jgi:hypothetical protein
MFALPNYSTLLIIMAKVGLYKQIKPGSIQALRQCKSGPLSQTNDLSGTFMNVTSAH